MFLSSSLVDSWCHQVKHTHDLSILTSLINGYRAACHYGSESTSNVDAIWSCRIGKGETFSKILLFMLREADNLFRERLGLLSSSCKKEMILELRNTTKWKTLKPLIKSYLRSSLFLLNEASETEILSFSLARIRASIIYFAAFPSLQRRLTKVCIWFTWIFLPCQSFCCWWIRSNYWHIYFSCPYHLTSFRIDLILSNYESISYFLTMYEDDHILILHVSH